MLRQHQADVHAKSYPRKMKQGLEDNIAPAPCRAETKQHRNKAMIELFTNTGS